MVHTCMYICRYKDTFQPSTKQWKNNDNGNLSIHIYKADCSLSPINVCSMLPLIELLWTRYNAHAHTYVCVCMYICTYVHGTCTSSSVQN